MTNVESMDYTHSHPSIIASLYGTMHCPFSHRELVQTSPVHPNPVVGVKTGGSRVGGPELCV